MFTLKTSSIPVQGLVFIQFIVGVHMPYSPEECNPGDLVLALFPPIRMLCDNSVELKYYLRYIALRNHMVKINQDPSLFFFQNNITLGYVIVETCSSMATAAHFASRIRPSWLNYIEKEKTCKIFDSTIQQKIYYVIGGVGDASSGPTEIISYIFQSNDLYMISSTASSDILADENRHPNLLRMVPPDSYQGKVIADIIVHYRLSYVIVLFNDTSYGRDMVKSFLETIETNSLPICIAFQSALSGISPDFEEKLIKRILSYRRAKAIVYFGNWKHYLLEGIKDKGYFFIGSDATREIPKQYSAFFKGSLFLNSKFVDIPGTIDKFNSLTYNKIAASGSAYDKKFWEVTHNCCFDPYTSWVCTKCSENLNSNSSVNNLTIELNTLFDKTLDAISIFSKAIDNLFQDGNCSLPIENAVLCLTPDKLGPVLKSAEIAGLDGPIKFNENGNIQAFYLLKQHLGDPELQLVGNWSEIYGLIVDESLQLLNNSGCSDPCQLGHARIDLTPCCWSCRMCRDNEFVFNGSSCEVCPRFSWPDTKTDLTTCKAIPIDYVDFGSAQYVSMAVIGVFGILATLGVLIFYVIFRNNQLLKASSLNLSLVSLLGICLSFVTLLLFGGKPSIQLCSVRNFLYHLSLTVPYASLLVKTSRIFRVFAASRKGHRHPKLVGSISVLSFTSLLCAVQVLLLLAITWIQPLTPLVRMPDNYIAYIETYCPSRSSPTFWIPFGYNLTLVVACSSLAFVTRSLPDNFHDSKCIFASAAVCLLAWLAFIPSLLTSNSSAAQDLLIALALSMTSWAVLATVFIPKVYGIFTSKETHLHFYNRSERSAVAPKPA